MSFHTLSKYYHGCVVTVSLTAGMFVAMLSLSAAFPSTTYAATPFGGLVTAIIPEQKVCTPVGCVTICPKHMMLTNYANKGNLLGVYSGTLTKTYSRGNLYQIGKYLLGDHVLTPYATCITPYRVYQLSRVGTS